jgi:hypothetical protein
MKTGYTDAAGYCLVASARASARTASGACSAWCWAPASREARANESQKLLNWGYSAWDAVRLFEAGKPVSRCRCGRAQARGALGAEAGDRGRAQGRRRQAEDQVERTDPLVAPLAQGQRVGTIKVTTAAGAGGRSAAGGAGGRWSWRACWAAPGTRSGCGSSNAAVRPRVRCHNDRLRRSRHEPDTPVLPQRRVPADVAGARCRCSTAASSSATASTRWCRCTAGACSASTSTWRGWSARWPSIRIPNPHSRTSGCSAAGAGGGAGGRRGRRTR